MRLFAALDVADDVRGDLDAAVAPLRERYEQLAWTPAHQWHLTVAFLGSVDGARVPEVSAALAPVAASAPDSLALWLGAAGHFGRRVLWVEVHDAPAGTVRDLGRDAQRALRAADLPVDEKPVRPHITLARPRDRNGKLPGGLVEEVPEVAGGWTVRSLVLFASVPGGHRQPNRYEVVVRYPFAA